VLERHSLFMISRDVSPAKHSPARAHISAIGVSRWEEALSGREMT